MIKKLVLLFFSVTLIQNSNCFEIQFSSEISKTVKHVLAKWENKELDLGVGCAQQLYQLLENLITFDDGLWAYKMIDATGKFPSGLAEGNIVVMGSFDECLDVKSDTKNVTGNYCSITIDLIALGILSAEQALQNEFLTHYENLTKLRGETDDDGQPIGSLPFYGVCLPNKCSANDVRNALHALTSLIPLRIKCLTKDEAYPALNTGAIVTIAVIGVVIILMVCSTLIDYIYKGKEIKPHPILISFSTYTNGKKLFGMSGQGELGCLNGIRFLSMCWVILGHTFIMNLIGPEVIFLELLTYIGKPEAMFHLNIAHAVDSFFVLSGLLVAYNFMKKMKKGEKFNIFIYYIHRYLRLTPAYAVVILCTIYLVKYLGIGPVSHMVDSLVVKECRDHWWSALLYLQNYFAGSDLCVTQSWNLSVDYQLYLFSPILLFLLYKMPRIGTITIALPIIGCMIAGFVITHQNSLPGLISTGDTTAYMSKYYFKTHTRAATWLIGASLGYVLGRIKFYNDKRFSKIPMVVVILIWLVVLALIPVCIFGFHDMLTSKDYDLMGNSLYNSFIRPIWALCVSWVIFACTNGYGGVINYFLSLPIFGVLSRFTYCMYLLHLTILDVMIFSRKMPAYFSISGVMNQFCTLFAVSFALSIFWILAFEMPILIIEPYLFGNRPKASTKNQQVPMELTSNSGNIERTSYVNEVHLKVENGTTSSGQMTEIRP